MAIVAAVTAGLVSIALLVVVALWYAGFPELARDDAITTQTIFDLLKIAFALVAGVGGVVGLVVAYRRQRVAEHSNQLAEFSHRLAHSADERAEAKKVLENAAEERAKLEVARSDVRLFNDRFGRASDQLGSEKAAVRLAGLYAMAGLADNWKEGRQTCVDVMCAYLRMPYMPPPTRDSGKNEEGGEGRRAAEEEREVRQTALRLIADHLRLPDNSPNSWQGIDLDFTGATIDGADFNNAVFGGGRVSFSYAKFVGGLTEFFRANFGGARVSFSNAHFRSGQIRFAEAKFSRGSVNFDAIRLDGALLNFAGASLREGASLPFWHSTLSGGELRLASVTLNHGSSIACSDATLNGAEVSFKNAHFNGGTFSLRGAKVNAGSIRFEEAQLSSHSVDLENIQLNGGIVSFEGALYTPSRYRRMWAGEPPVGLILPPEPGAEDAND
ncbi:pentapeptide repeat-containing protein [Actinoplanes sp. TBRC 11911]|uniref:pentapeptide repeat-containing protein n=1 Tax=Actinoplanes sp. TBRC 11911 TaxID=2729386 RepID=UPI00145E73AA|nr:pentapeptide repeat-containing protein [Actinoplanes sp. TBRC 11911]NMO57755.1 pentapeptide repeat-containing protein [Actinoplanes sp. TBRC 11911]